MAGEIDVGPTGSVTPFPTSNVKVAFGDTANMQYTLTEVELNRITAGDTLTIGSGEVEMLWVSGIQSARTGATKIVASKTGAAIVLQKEYEISCQTEMQVVLEWGAPFKRETTSQNDPPTPPRLRHTKRATHATHGGG